ncbi:MAG: fatty acid CoA ligase FadD9, partial [Kribbellaceae bacterium]|nr:fatty acid CoA ligase FadD9 [Kribbellaceae bacterium]
MSTDSREDRLARRVADLYSTDIQFADARPIEALTAAIEQPGLRLSRIMSTVMGAYAERPAVGERAVNL